MGFPGSSAGKEFACNAEDPGLIPWRRKWLPTPVFLPGASHGQRSLAGYSQWGHKESNRTERLNRTEHQKIIFECFVCVCECVCVCACVHVCMLSCFRLFETLWTLACQASLSMGCSRQEYWSVLPHPPPGDLPDPGLEPRFLG